MRPGRSLAPAPLSKAHYSDHARIAYWLVTKFPPRSLGEGNRRGVLQRCGRPEGQRFLGQTPFRSLSPSLREAAGETASHDTVERHLSMPDRHHSPSGRALTTPVQSQPTMSTNEIADLTGKRHDHVMRDTRKMLSELHGEGGLPKFGGSYIGQDNTTRPCFNLPKRETLILVSGYNLKMRAAIVDRWQELEAQPTINPVVMLNDPAAMKAIGGVMKSVIHKALREVLPQLVERELLISQAAIARGMTAGEVLDEAGVTNRKGHRGIVRRVSDALRRYAAEQHVAVSIGRLGSNSAYIFEGSLARNWLRDGGKAFIDRLIEEKRGQGALRLICE